MKAHFLRIVGLVGCGVAASAPAEEPLWQALPLPGGIGGLSRAAGLDPVVEPWRVLFETSRRLHPTYGDPADAARLRERVRAHFHAAAPRVVRGPDRQPEGRLLTLPDGGMGSTDDSVSVPLSPGLRRKVVAGLSATDDRFVETLLGDRGASLVYRGLFQLDEPTLRFLGQHLDLVSWIKANRADVFSVFAGSLRVRDGRVEVPGGKEAEYLWEDVVGESPARAERFLRVLLSRDEGRGAFLLHSLAHQTPASLRFALGPQGSDPEQRRQRFRALAGAVGQGPAWWRPEGGAFARPLVDPAVVLGLVRVETDGEPSPPAGRAFWEAAFAGEVPAAADVDRFRQDTSFDAAWLAEKVGLASRSGQRRERLTQLAFAQRVFGDIAHSDLPNTLLALRGLARYPALVLVLDRMDIRTPAVYAQAVRRAESMNAVDGRSSRAALAQLQGAVAILDRARFARTLGAKEAESLVTSLAAVPLAGGRYAGALATWIEELLLPAFRHAQGADPPSASDEGTVLAAMAGDQRTARDTPPFEWEGLWYRSSPGIAEGRRLQIVRERQGGNTLDAVLAFSSAARRFEASPGAESQARLREAARQLDAGALSSEEKRALEVPEAFAHRAQTFVQLADDLLAHVLASLAYAPHLGPTQGTALAGGNVALRHEFGAQAWALPEEILGAGPWRVRGSLLALDVALARLSLRRLSGDMPTRAPGVDPRSRLAFARSVALRSPYAFRDDEATAIVETIARGRRRAARAREEDAHALVRDGGLDPWRAQGLRATLQDAPLTVSTFFTLAELLRLGGPAPAGGEAFGTPDLSRGGSLRLLPPPTGGYEDLLGQRLEDLHAARAFDLVLRVAVELHARHLPAGLAPGVLSLLTQDLVQEAAPVSHEDWLALARFARDVPSERFDEYVSALSGEGPLVPASDPSETQSP